MSAGDPGGVVSAEFEFENVDLGPSVRPRRRAPDGLTRALVVTLGLALAFSGGVRAGRASRPSAPPAAPGAGSPAADRRPPATGEAVSGRVSIVDRELLYLTDAQGHMVKVLVTDEARLSTVRAASLADLHVGDTVVVEGQRALDGTISASSITNDYSH